jgi:Na+-transporting NADH:ubiquinone oxidoreductase subunit E
MTDLWGLFLTAAFVDNMPLTLFLGLCTFLALSKRPEAAIGLGVAMTGVLGVTVPLNHLIYQGVLAPGAWAWAGRPELDLSYLSLIAFIGVIAASVQLLEMVLDRFFPAIHAAFGVFLPLLTVQCAILAGSLFMVERSYTLAQSTVFGLGSGVGFAVAVAMLSAIRMRLSYADLPAGLRGLGIAFVLAGLMSLGFASFAQMAAAQ